MFQRVDPNTFGKVDRVHVPVGRYLGASWEQGEHDSIMASMERLSGFNLERDDSRMLGPEEANDLFGVGDRLRFNEPITENRARMLNREHTDLARREFILSQVPLASPKGVAGFVTQIAGANLNPADIALNFIPIVGQAKYAKSAKTATTMWGAARNRLASGVLGTTDSLVGSPGARRFQAAVINGAVGNAVAEVPLALSNKQFQVRYGWTDFSVNVAFGALFAGGIHGLGRAAGKLLDSLDPVRKQEALMKAFADALEGRDVDVEPVVRSDPKVAQMETDEARLRNVEEEVGVEWEKGTGQDTQKTWLDLFLDNLVFNHIKSGVESPAVIVRQKGTSARSILVRGKRGVPTGERAQKPTVVTARTHGDALALARKEFGDDVEYEMGYRQKDGGFVSEQTLFEGMTMEEVKMLQGFLRQINQKRMSAVAQDPEFRALHEGDNYRRNLEGKIAELDRMIARAEGPDAPVDMANRIGRIQGEIMRRLNKELEMGLLRDGQQARYRESMVQNTVRRVDSNRRDMLTEAFGPLPLHLENGGLDRPPPPIREVPGPDPAGTRTTGEVDAEISDAREQLAGMSEEERVLVNKALEEDGGKDMDMLLREAKETDSKAIKLARDCMLSNG